MTRTKSPILYHSSASVLLMRKITNIINHLEQAYLALRGQDKPVNVRIRPEPLMQTMELDGPILVILLLNYASICTH